VQSQKNNGNKVTFSKSETERKKEERRKKFEQLKVKSNPQNKDLHDLLVCIMDELLDQHVK
jgi:hypothetical protein